MARPLGTPKPDASRPEKRKHDDETTPNDKKKKKKKQRLEDNAAKGTSSEGPTSRSVKDGTRRASVTSQPEHVNKNINKKSNKRTGRYTPEEVQILESYKVNICNSHSINPEAFDAIIQGSLSGPPIGIQEIREGIYELIPDRDQRSIRRFLLRHFVTGNEPHKWTTEDEDNLERLYKKHGPKFALIARDMDRTYDDVVQRWKNKVEHRSTMKEGPWDNDEISELIQILEKAHEIHKQEGTKNLGKDIYEMSEKHINWGAISDLMGNTRSRQQCADRWRNMKLVVKRRRKNGDLSAVYEIVRTRTSSPKKSTKSSRSKEYVNDNDSSSSSDSSDDSSSDESSEDDSGDEDDIALQTQLSQELGKSAAENGTEPQSESDSENSPGSDQKDASDGDGDSDSDSSSEDDSHSQLPEDPGAAEIPNQVDSDNDSDSDSDVSSNGGDIAFAPPPPPSDANIIRRWASVNA